jgi:hypothetical protein
MERMAFDQPLEYELGPSHDSETLDRQHSIRGTGGSETTAWPKEGGKGMPVEMNQENKSFLGKLMGRSLLHKTKRLLSSSSAS